MRRYRTRSQIVEAVQWDGTNAEKVIEFCEANDMGYFSIEAFVEDWWVTSCGDEFSNSEFQRLYEPLPESTLDLEAIEARWKGWGQPWQLLQDLDDLIAEVRRLTNG